MNYLLFFLWGEIGHQTVKAHLTEDSSPCYFDLTRPPNPYMNVKEGQSSTPGVSPLLHDHMTTVWVL